jgi:mono/diheme cytochrome c family protein
MISFLVSGLTFAGISLCNFSENYTYSSKSPLEKYGEYIYQRENCAQCHTLHIQENPDLNSLDGLGGKYKSGWLAILMEEPSLLFYDTKMPPHRHLFEKSLTKEIAEKELKFKNEDWNQLLSEAKITYEILVEEYRNFNDLSENHPIIINQKTEVLALIKYLQQIPESKAYKMQDSMKVAKQNLLKLEWEELLNHSNSIIYKELSNPTTIELGKICYKNNCLPCHNTDGKGGIGPNLTDDYWIYGGSDHDIARVITLGGKEGKGMIAFSESLSPEEINHLLAYIRSLKGSNPKDAKAAEGYKY